MFSERPFITSPTVPILEEGALMRIAWWCYMVDCIIQEELEDAGYYKLKPGDLVYSDLPARPHTIVLNGETYVSPPR